ncbi:hypothetical protein FDF74_02910 [Clostridium niameyense]|uniref:M50 family metallopeptidase n=1 Tax=Clostridium niameyense TaxID=1622073 RepID=A0A6M0R941_9CLOT|nr:hypothetical protein [Clostridium niameyense]NEZ46160.1 hypothetical protein [Clostridium niameyense]
MKEKTNEDISNTLKFLFWTFGGALSIIGFIIGVTNSSKSPINSIVYFIILICTCIFQIILHEAGHLIFGLCSGYKFISFRIGNITLIRENRKLKIKKFNVVGTAGQCIMMPPEGSGYDCPYIIYNLGGVFMNTIVILLCILFYKTFTTNFMVKNFCFLSIIIGIFFIIINGIPIKILGNDGYNFISMKKDKYERYSFYMMLKINSLLYKGIRLKDMPIEWFKLPNGANSNKLLSNTIRILEGNYYMDKRDFHKAIEIYKSIINTTPNLNKVLKNEVICDILFCEIINEAGEDVINKLYTKELKDYIKATNCYMSRKRLMYAYYLLVKKDNTNANPILDEVNKVKKTYPVKAEIESELQIIEFVKSKYSIL